MNTKEILQGIKDWAAPKVVYDISAAHNNTKYTDLSDALGTNGGNIPQEYRKGGITVRYVQSSDNKYVRFSYLGTSTAVADFTNVANWQGVDEEPTPISKNLVESGGVIDIVNSSLLEINGRISIVEHVYCDTSVGQKYSFVYNNERNQTPLIKKVGNVSDCTITIKGATPSIFVWLDANFIVILRENASTPKYWNSNATYLSIGFNDSANPNGYDNLQVYFNRSIEQELLADGWKYNGIATTSNSPRQTEGNEPAWYIAVGPGTLTNYLGTDGNPINLTSKEIYTLRENTSGNLRTGRFIKDSLNVWSIDGVKGNIKAQLIDAGYMFGGFVDSSSSPIATKDYTKTFYIAIGPCTLTNFPDPNGNSVVLSSHEFYLIRQNTRSGVALNEYISSSLRVWSIDGVKNHFQSKLEKFYALSSGIPKISPSSSPEVPDASYGLRRIFRPVTYGTYSNFPDYETSAPIVVGYNEVCIIREHWSGDTCDGYIKDTIYISDKASSLYSGYRVQDNYQMYASFSSTPTLEISTSSDTAAILPVIEKCTKKIKLNLNGTNISFIATVVSFNDSISTLVGITELDCSLYKKIGLLVRLSGSDATVLTEEQIKQLIIEPDNSEIEDDIAQAVSDWLDEHPEATTSVQDGSISVQKLDTSLANKADRLRLDDTHPASTDYKTGDGFNTIVGYGNRGKGLGTGRGNNILGTGNLYFATTANRNVAIGHHSQYRQVDGEENVSIGNEASDNINGDGNTSVGANALRAQKYAVFPGQVEVTNPEQVQIEECTAIGRDTLLYCADKRNTAVGARSMKGVLVEGVGCTGIENTSVGYSTKTFHKSGSGNTAVGSYAQAYNETGSNNVAIGYRAGCYQQSGNNKLFIDGIGRGNAADELTKSLIVGEFHSNPNSQQFTINAGLICMPYLPTSDPQVAGALWNNNGVLKISSGS